jgi:hypothetical protein
MKTWRFKVKCKSLNFKTQVQTLGIKSLQKGKVSQKDQQKSTLVSENTLW